MGRRGAVATLVCVTFFGGCGGGIDLPPMAPVAGIVTFDGKPLTHGSVKFVPGGLDDSGGPSSSGEIQSDGTFVLETVGEEGAVIGNHRVSITAFKQVGEGVGGMMQPLIPPRYFRYDQSGLTATVEDVRENKITFELTSGR